MRIKKKKLILTNQMLRNSKLSMSFVLFTISLYKYQFFTYNFNILRYNYNHFEYY